MSGSKLMRPCSCLPHLCCLILALSLWPTPTWAATTTNEAVSPENAPARALSLSETTAADQAPQADSDQPAPQTTQDEPTQDKAPHAAVENLPQATNATAEIAETETRAETTAADQAPQADSDQPAPQTTQDEAPHAMASKPLTPGLLLPEQNLSIELPPTLPNEAPKEGPTLPELPSLPEVQSQPMAAPLPSQGQSLPELRFEPQSFPTLEHPEEAKVDPPAPAVEVAPEPPPQPVTVKLKRAKKKRHICPPCPACPTCPVCPEPPKDETLTLDLILFGKIQGDFAFIDCRDATGQSDQFAYASQVALFHALSDLARRQELLAPVAFNLGDSTFPGAFANFLFSQGEAGATELATLLSKIPYEGLTLGNHDFAPPRDESLRFFEAARRARLPFLGANLRCATSETSDTLCALLGTNDNGRPYRLIQRGPP